MKISLNWIKEYTEVHLKTDELLERIGSRLGAIEEVINLEERYAGIVVAKVITSEKHPDADKLHVCTIDDGGVVKDVPRDAQGRIQVVCGAPNVEAGMLTAWIPPGAVVPATFDKDPLKVEAREIRGVLSQGMLASPSELAISDNHEGLLRLDQEAKPGVSFAITAKLNDQIIDIENKMFTHRPDCFGILGVAREIAGIQNIPFTSPDWYKKDITPQNPHFQGATLEMEVRNKAPELVPRFCAVALSGIEVKPSSVILQTLLARVGVKPINNIVDLTNYFMLETGQPLHAYDADKLRQAQSPKSQVLSLGTRLSKKGETLTLLGGKTIRLDDKSIVITAGDRVIGLGGVMGGADTEVDANTKNIILECANFDMNVTRRMAMEHGLFTDAAIRFTKGQSPLQNMAVLAKITQNILGSKHMQAALASAVFDEHGELPKPKTVEITTKFINSRLGLDLDAPTITKLLENVEFEVSADGEKLSITAPFWRTDIEIPEDIVEEVGRLYGYEHLPLVLPQKDLTPPSGNELLEFKLKIRDILSRAGANEALTYSFVHESLMRKAGQDPKNAYHIRNALSPDLQFYRISILPSLLEKVYPNIRQGFDEFALFELGKGHVKDDLDNDGLPKEYELLTFVYANKKIKSGSPYFVAKKFCEYLLESLDIEDVSYRQLNKNEISSFFEPNRSAIITIKGQPTGQIGELLDSVKGALKLPKDCAGFELSVEHLLGSSSGTSYKPLNRFPSLEQDITLKSTTEISYAKLFSSLKHHFETAAKEHGYTFQLTPLDIFRRDDDENHKQTTWHITLAHPRRTLTTEETNKLLDIIVSATKEQLGAERV